jgi:2-polyprenyl-3-methyl-5-hydroxy-6-metoxy-1,4-benzoquinol methylase
LVNTFLPSVDNGRIIQRLESGIQVCDLGCSEGVAVILMAEAFPQSRFVGIDISPEAIDEARRQARQQKIENLDFWVQDAADLKSKREMKGLFDYVTAFDAIHDQTRPLDVLRGVNHMLTPDGRFSMVDIAANSNLADNLAHPMGPFLYTVSLMHCMPVGLEGGGTGLGMMWGRQKAVEMLRDAQFQKVQVLEMPDDPFNLHFFCCK